MTTPDRTWGQPVEVPGMEYPDKYGKDSPHAALLIDLFLRLEKTPKNKALYVPFDSEKTARVAIRALSQSATKRIGRQHIEFRRATRDGVPVICVRRGPNWGKNGKPEQEISRKEKGDDDDDN